MLVIGLPVTTPQGSGVIVGTGTTAAGVPTVVIDHAGRMVRFSGSDLYRINPA